MYTHQVYSVSLNKDYKNIFINENTRLFLSLHLYALQMNEARSLFVINNEPNCISLSLFHLQFSIK